MRFSRGAWRALTRFGLAVMVLGLSGRGAVSTAAAVPDSGGLANRAALAQIRDRGDLAAQRQHAWMLLLRLSQDGHGRAEFESWHGESDLFGEAPTSALGIRGFSAHSQSLLSSASAAGIPVISYTLYNPVAYRHILDWSLNRLSGLKQLRAQGARDTTFPTDRAVPPFPAASIVLKSVWWPVAHDGFTALPVWDPGEAPRRVTGNGYTTWRRVVAIAPVAHATPGRANVTFEGQPFAHVSRFALDAFYSVVVDRGMAARLMADEEARRTSLIALGRTMHAGDYLVLVGANLATRELPDWVWAAFWWSDQAARGVFGADRPAALASNWQHYMMQVAFDAQTPTEPDGGAHICFNPWLEGRFPDGGHGAGMVSNCMACHRRASYPAIDFLPVTRGTADEKTDPAYAPGRLRTGFLWSLALHAR